MKASKRLWAELQIQTVPSHALESVGTDRFELLDMYLRDCLEEWSINEGKLSAHSIVLLDYCACTLRQHSTLLSAEAHSYFEQFQLLASRILRTVDVKHAYFLAEQARASDPELAYFFGELPSEPSS